MDEDKKAAPEAEVPVMQQSYPSPVVDNAEAQYYEQLAQHRELEPQMEQQSAQPEHHGLPIVSEHQGHNEHQDRLEQHEHHELHQLQRLQEPTAPQQHSSRAPDGVDDLQIAAQLTQVMAASVQDRIQEEQQPISRQDGQEEQMQAQAEPNLQEQLEASLQNHEREMQSHHHELQNHSHQLEGHELRPALPHDQAQHRHYVQNPPPGPHLAHHMSMEHLPQTHPSYQMPDATPPRKRSKVSRACDECRRKKIKCDAESEATDQPCSNCRRANAQCMFSRVPQKRGPSKGYIKELADRINTIEGKLSTNVEGLERGPSSEVFASPGLGDDSRKRPFSSVSGDGFQPPSPNRISSAFATDHRPILPYLHPDHRPEGPGVPADLAVKPALPVQFSGASNDIGLQGQSDMMDGIPHNGQHQGPSHPADQPSEIDDTAFNRYLEVIHPTFPVLASTKARVQSLLWQSPSALQNAFYSALQSLVKPFLPDSASSGMEGDPAAACRLLSDWEVERKPRSSVTDLVRFQTLIMALISVDCHGIALAKDQLGGPSKPEILGRAVGHGYSMRIQHRVIDPDLSPELDPNSDDNVALRAWWVLAMLDRWNAVGTATPTLISNDNIVIQPGLKHVVGEVVFTLIRISFVLGHVVPIAISPSMDPLSHGAAVLGTFASGATQMLGWFFPNGRADPVLHLAYWHVRLLSELLSEERVQRAANILQATKKMVGILASNHDLLTPLTHHFTTLASLGLLELHLLKDSRDEAAKVIRNVLDYSISPSPWNAAVREKLAERLQGRPGSADGSPSGQKSRNLQQLADVATAVDGSAAATATVEEKGVKEQQPHAPASNGTTALAENGANGSGDGQDGGEPSSARARGDVLGVLRNGYLTWFDEAQVDVLV
ncbi:hypothetical protein N658DRAFT_472962 [Parathielavia hyrcaniae]|uniref:Zn(2)-C6 fungal-type domain-containing protein n=1 Tax=Parathielavia hyrcaniae TaxID=113614 RepID=A0AAN6Q3Y3_9PEZI|nr:hypothetical protein N658DRAFT_472962 [Parathielavia hyrcaniae]